MSTAENTPTPTLSDWVAGARPRTLPAAVVPVAVGAGVAAGLGESFGDGVVWWRVAAALVVSLGSDVLDYGFGYHPPLRYEVGLVLPLITVALSFVSVFAASHAMGRLDD